MLQHKKSLRTSKSKKRTNKKKQGINHLSHILRKFSNTEELEFQDQNDPLNTSMGRNPHHHHHFEAQF